MTPLLLDPDDNLFVVDGYIPQLQRHLSWPFYLQTVRY